jgi:hypothetical protein
MRFIYISGDSVPLITTTLLVEACAARDIEMVYVTAAGFLFDPESALRPGDILYRSAITLAMRVEQFLFSE